MHLNLPPPHSRVAKEQWIYLSLSTILGFELLLIMIIILHLQVLEPSRVLSVIHSFDCHSGQVASVSVNSCSKN